MNPQELKQGHEYLIRAKFDRKDYDNDYNFIAEPSEYRIYLAEKSVRQSVIETLEPPTSAGSPSKYSPLRRFRKGDKVRVTGGLFEGAEGYIKRITKSAYRSQNRGGRGVTGMTTKEEDYAVQMRVVGTHDEIMFFTNLGRVYMIKCYQIPEAGRQARGTAIINLLHIAGEENVSTMLPQTVVIDANGIITYNATGSVTYEMLEKLVAEAALNG